MPLNLRIFGNAASTRSQMYQEVAYYIFGTHDISQDEYAYVVMTLESMRGISSLLANDYFCHFLIKREDGLSTAAWEKSQMVENDDLPGIHITMSQPYPGVIYVRVWEEVVSEPVEGPPNHRLVFMAELGIPASKFYERAKAIISDTIKETPEFDPITALNEFCKDAENLREFSTGYCINAKGYHTCPFPKERDLPLSCFIHDQSYTEPTVWLGCDPEVWYMYRIYWCLKGM